LLLVGLGLGLGLGCDKRSSDAKTSGEAKSKSELTPEDERKHELMSPDEWKPYTAEKCGYSVELPHAPGPKKSHSGVVDSVSLEGLEYALVSMCMDEDLGDPVEAVELMADGQTSLWPGATAEVEPIELHGWPGRAIDLLVPNDQKPAMFDPWPGDLKVRVRLYIVGGRLYQLQTVSSADLPLADKAAERFFASFRLLETPPKPPERLEPPK
jgi:hypothetical protein